MSEKSITRQQAGFVRQRKTSRRNSAELVGAALVANSFLSRAGEAYDARDKGPNRKSWLEIARYPGIEEFPNGSGRSARDRCSQVANARACDIFPVFW